jgi:hypothetical protein
MLCHFNVITDHSTKLSKIHESTDLTVVAVVVPILTLASTTFSKDNHGL